MSLGDLFNSCLEPIIILNDSININGVLSINVSLLGNDCQLISGSGSLFNLTFIPKNEVLVQESFIYINSNSTLRNRNNDEVPISNIITNYPLTSRVQF
jgi:hypothetical protein